MGVNCFCPGCKTGLKSDRRDRKLRGEKVPSLFKPPEDPVLFEMWQKVIPRADRVLRHKDFVCAKHFKKEDFVYHQEPIKLFDGSVYLHMFVRPKLRRGAIPSVFGEVPGHSTYVPKIKAGDNIKCSKRKRPSSATKQLKVPKVLNNSSGTEHTETRNEKLEMKKKRSKEKENVLKTDISLLPQILLNCLTSEPHAILSTSNKLSQSTAKDNLSSKSSTSNLQLDVKNTTLEKNISPKQLKLSNQLQSKIPERVSSLTPKSTLSSNSKVISSQSNLKNNVSVVSEVISQSSKFTNDFPSTSSEIVQLSDSQSNLLFSDATHKQASHPSSSSTESFAILQPLNPEDILTSEPCVVLEPTNNQSNLTIESNHCSQTPNSSMTNEVTPQHPDTNFAESRVFFTEIGMDLPLSVAKEQFSFNFLKINAHTIDKMNSWWTVNCFDNFIVCARWNSDCLVERKIVIYENLKVKVFLKEKETTIGNDLETVSIETISKLIFRVERLRLCKNIQRQEGNCFGYLQPDARCRKRNICLNCIEWEKEQLRQLKKHIRVSRNHVELMRFYMGT